MRQDRDIFLWSFVFHNVFTMGHTYNFFYCHDFLVWPAMVIFWIPTIFYHTLESKSKGLFLKIFSKDWKSCLNGFGRIRTSDLLDVNETL